MRKTKINLACVGLVVTIVVGCAANNAGGSGVMTSQMTTTRGGVFSETHTLLLPFGVESSALAVTGRNSEVTSLVHTGDYTNGAGNTISPKEKSEMYRINFQHKSSNVQSWGGFDFVDPARNPIDISDFAGGDLVFSIDYQKLFPIPSRFELRITDTNGARYSTELSNFIASNRYAPEKDGDWYTYRIPLADFSTPGDTPLDLTSIRSPFGLWNPFNGADPSNGEVYLDDVYFEVTK